MKMCKIIYIIYVEVLYKEAYNIYTHYQLFAVAVNISYNCAVLNLEYPKKLLIIEWLIFDSRSVLEKDRTQSYLLYCLTFNENQWKNYKAVCAFVEAYKYKHKDGKFLLLSLE